MKVENKEQKDKMKYKIKKKNYKTLHNIYKTITIYIFCSQTYRQADKIFIE